MKFEGTSVEPDIEVNIEPFSATESFEWLKFDSGAVSNHFWSNYGVFCTAISAALFGVISKQCVLWRFA